MNFRNTPGEGPVVVEKRKYANRVEHKKRNSGVVVRNIFFIGLVVFVLVYFVPGIFRTAWKINSVRSEIDFTIKHPEIVKPIRELYELSHKKTDDDLLKILEVK